MGGKTASHDAKPFDEWETKPKCFENTQSVDVDREQSER